MQIFELCVATMNISNFRMYISLAPLYSHKLLQTLSGHGGPIRSLIFHPTVSVARKYCTKKKEPDLLFSSSDDGSIRVWNISQGMLISIFGGYEGHHGPVVSTVSRRKKELIVAGLQCKKETASFNWFRQYETVDMERN